MSEKEIFGWRIAWVGDFLGRAGIVAYFSWAASARLGSIYSGIVDWSTLTMDHKLLWLLSQIAVLLFLLLVVATTFVRLKPIQSAEGIEPRFTALAGTFLLGLLALTPSSAPPPPTIAAIALVLVMVGFSVSTYVLYWLGRSFSIMAEARRLVTGGPYRIVRHPLYLAEEVAIIGVVLLNFTPLGMLIGLVHWGLQIRRMHNEERVLRAVFAEYDTYAASTPKVIPQFIRPMLRKAA
jgi:protein-S-isoprenylcysteine O-methyltransferase Ste14